MGSSAINALGFIIGTVFNLYATVVGLRFVMQVVRADYYNPVAQFVVQATDPLLKPMRRVIPGTGRYDSASLILVVLVLLIKFILFKVLSLGFAPAFGLNINAAALSSVALPLAAVVDTVHLFFNIFIFALFIQALLSWLPNAQGNPVQGLLHKITQPVLQPIRRIVPVMGGLDLSVMVAIIGLYALRIFVVGTLSGLVL